MSGAAFWSANVVGHMRGSRMRDPRVSFAEAWVAALRMYPARGADAGLATPTLFDEHGDVPESQTAFLKRVAEDAWYDRVGEAGSGNGPALRYFSSGMIEEYEEPALRGLAA